MAQKARATAASIEMLETKFEYIENVLEYHLSNSKKLLDFHIQANMLLSRPLLKTNTKGRINEEKDS